MSNLALGKLPLEKDTWNKPEEATNGNTNKYNGYTGFASSNWPCIYTIDLGEERKIQTIRFLLWDNLGEPGNQKNKRKYTFTLRIGIDENNFTEIYTNQEKEGGNGWYIFNLVNETYARYIQLVGHYNSVNKEFHIVEFEVHDDYPQSLLSNNQTKIDIVSGIPGSELINTLIDKAISQKSNIFIGLEEKLNKLDSLIENSTEALDQIELIKHTHDYLKESVKNNNRSNIWLVSSIITLIIFILTLVWFVFHDDKSIDIIKDAQKDILIKPFTIYLLGAYYVTKTIFLSTILFILSWMLKNYRSERHNYVINKHKAMTLTVATGILTRGNFQNANTQNIFNQGMEIIFTHQSSGYSKEENSSPNIINTLLQKGIPKIDK